MKPDMIINLKCEAKQVRPDKNIDKIHEIWRLEQVSGAKISCYYIP